MIAIKEVLKVRRYKAGYEIRHEVWDDEPYGGDGNLVVKSAYTPTGDYIGNSEEAHFLCKKRGIAPEKAHRNHCVCSIGFCEREQKYYGWSHRAICGFGIGDKVFEERYGDDYTPFVEHGHRTIETLEDAREAAVNFAGYVS